MRFNTLSITSCFAPKPLGKGRQIEEDSVKAAHDNYKASIKILTNSDKQFPRSLAPDKKPFYFIYIRIRINNIKMSFIC